MQGSKMETVMSAFIEGAYDVLVSTTIVESGLDIPNANTIMINQAHMYGLSDLHQMRGRVGRSNRKAYCYLLAPPESMLSRDAKKRLKAIEELSDIGSGFHISLRDLDIRGAGDLFGPEQSGFVSEIGYDMYHRILDEAVLELKEEYFGDVFRDEIKKKHVSLVEDTQVETDRSILIPERYIPGISERLNFYNRIAAAVSEEDLRTISIEMIDRFGVIPVEVLGLLDTVRIRQEGKLLGFEKVVLNGDLLRLYFPSDRKSAYYSGFEFGRILAWVQMHHPRFKLKESPKYLSMVVEKVKEVKEILSIVREMNTWLREEKEKV
jgi:transcription-repair coupling factor (superfamily II helicase)